MWQQPRCGTRDQGICHARGVPKRGRAAQGGCSSQGVNWGQKGPWPREELCPPADKIPEPALLSLVPCRTGRVPCPRCSTEPSITCTASAGCSSLPAASSAAPHGQHLPLLSPPGWSSQAEATAERLLQWWLLHRVHFSSWSCSWPWQVPESLPRAPGDTSTVCPCCT